ncbi:MAG: hypothetical protein M3O87_07115 [Candidatus Dormibacteraeota bacterium]|nr:hypothetical protein [Candidatus Dormibacteraeota bacterium]
MAAPALTDDRISKIATGISVARVGVGAIAIIAPGVLRRVMGSPASHDSASLDMFSRLFGVREIAVGMHSIAAVQSSPRKPDVYAHNALVDGADAAVMLVTAIKGGGARRAAIGGFFTAVPVVATWLWLRQEAARTEPSGLDL